MDQGTLELVLKTIEDYGKRTLTSEARLKIDAENRFPEEIIRELLGDQIGLHLVFIPEAHGGLGGGAYDVYRVSAALAEVDLGIATAFLAISLGMDPIRVGGTQAQKDTWIGRIASEGLIVAYGVTEPTAGSEVSAIRATADRIVDAGGAVTGYRLNGTKQFITNGSVAALYTILAKTPEGPSFFIVERGTKGLSAGRHEDKHGIRASDTSPVILEDVEVPVENLVGGVEGQGLRHAQEVFGFTRLMVAAFGLGAGTAAVKRAVAYAKERVQYGSPLSEKQGFMHRLIVPGVVALETARMYIEHVARRLDAGEEALGTEGAIAKFTATEAGNAAAEAAIQAHGGYGYIREYEVEKIKRDVRITTIYEGTSEIMLNTVGMDRWRSSIQSRFGWYAGLEDRMLTLGAGDAATGARLVAAAAKTLNETLKVAYQARLTRKQAVLFKLAEMMAAVESAAVVAQETATAGGMGTGLLGNGAGNPEVRRAVARSAARVACARVAEGCNLAVVGTGTLDIEQGRRWRRDSGLEALLDAAQGAQEDMDLIAGAVCL
jgi:alkylation response protein AidB-like acyl-CoA dehydrogenase